MKCKSFGTAILVLPLVLATLSMGCARKTASQIAVSPTLVSPTPTTVRVIKQWRTTTTLNSRSVSGVPGETVTISAGDVEQGGAEYKFVRDHAWEWLRAAVRKYPKRSYPKRNFEVTWNVTGFTPGATAWLAYDREKRQVFDVTVSVGGGHGSISDVVENESGFYEAARAESF